MGMQVYRQMERMFPNHIIIQKEGCFYSAHHKSARAMANILDYQLGVDYSGNSITGGPDMAKICAVLEKGNYSFLVVEDGKVVYGFHGDNPFEHNLY